MPARWIRRLCAGGGAACLAAALFGAAGVTAAHASPAGDAAMQHITAAGASISAQMTDICKNRPDC